MSDSLRVYSAMKRAVRQLYPEEPQGRRAQHLNVLAALMTGIVLGQSCQLPKIAAQVPGAAKDESRVKEYYRWLTNDGVEYRLYFLPFVQALLINLAQTRTLVFALDGSEVARGCLALMLSVIYQHRALPIAWVVVQGSKGHFPADTHVQLLERVAALLPARGNADVVVVGDGEFDGVPLLTAVEAQHWHYACRTAHNILVHLPDSDEWVPVDALGVTRGARGAWAGVGFTQADYGPVQVIAWWAADCKEPLYLVTNFELPDEACAWYQRRFRIETFFSDQKSRGFNLQLSHLTDPVRVARLMIATCLAYLWIIYLGALALRTGLDRVIHRTDRCDLSLFQLGLRLLAHLLKAERPILVSFQPQPSRARVLEPAPESVR